MTDAHDGFARRLDRIDRRHARLARGYASEVGRDGLIVFRPRPRRPTFPVKGLLLVVIGFFLFKALILAHLGAETYAVRVAALQAGNPVERAGAWAMQADPLSQAVSARIRPLLR